MASFADKDQAGLPVTTPEDVVEVPAALVSAVLVSAAPVVVVAAVLVAIVIVVMLAPLFLALLVGRRSASGIACW